VFVFREGSKILLAAFVLYTCNLKFYQKVSGNDKIRIDCRLLTFDLISDIMLKHIQLL